MLTTTANFRIINSDLSRSLANVAKQPIVERETAYYQANIGDVKSAAELVENDRLFAYAMRAHGLEEMTYARAFMEKVLSEGIDNEDSFANSLSDPRYREFAEAFNFERYGETATTFTRTNQGTVDKYIRQTLETDAGVENEGVRLALYFQRKAEDVTSAFSLLGDPALLAVTQVALSIPSASSGVDIDRQAAQIDARLDIEDLKDPEKLNKFLDRFTTLWEIQNPTASTAAPSVLIGNGFSGGISTNILSSIQNLKLGGR